MRDRSSDAKRRDAMAMAAAPYLHSKLSSAEPEPITDPENSEGVSSIEVSFVHSKCQYEDGEGEQ
jgi:hypothetical protein